MRETWAHDGPDLETVRSRHEDMLIGGEDYGPYYKATETFPGSLQWRPSIHMPRWASRITLEVTDVRVQRLQEISEEDAKAEGVEHNHACFRDDFQSSIDNTYRRNFATLWDSINAKRAPWASNPWVWVVTFQRIFQPQ